MGRTSPPTSAQFIFVNRANMLIFLGGVAEGADVDPLLDSFFLSFKHEKILRSH